MKDYVEEGNYLPALCQMLQHIEIQEDKAITEAAELVYKSMKTGGVLHVFATGHSHMIADELFYRSGGLAPINPVLSSDIMVYEGAINSTLVERQSGVAAKIFSKYQMQNNDCLLIASNSGINVAAIEAALLAKGKGMSVICVTSYDTSKELESRHPNGKKLYEVCDIVIDNHSPKGDGFLEIPQNKQRTGGASTFGCLFVAQRLVLKIENHFINDGELPPVFCSANVPGGDEFNKEIIKKYKSRIPALCK